MQSNQTLHAMFLIQCVHVVKNAAHKNKPKEILNNFNFPNTESQQKGQTFKTHYKLV